MTDGPPATAQPTSQPNQTASPASLSAAAHMTPQQGSSCNSSSSGAASATTKPQPHTEANGNGGVTAHSTHTTCTKTTTPTTTAPSPPPTTATTTRSHQQIEHDRLTTLDMSNQYLSQEKVMTSIRAWTRRRIVKNTHTHPSSAAAAATTTTTATHAIPKANDNGASRRTQEDRSRPQQQQQGHAMPPVNTLAGVGTGSSMVSGPTSSPSASLSGAAAAAAAGTAAGGSGSSNTGTNNERLPLRAFVMTRSVLTTSQENTTASTTHVREGTTVTSTVSPLAATAATTNTTATRQQPHADAGNNAVLAQLNALFYDHAAALQSVNCAGSNVSGRIFYRGKEFPVVDPSEEHVTVESTDRAQRDRPAIVRDDNPLLFFDDGALRYYYVRTIFTPDTNAFLRFYVILDWLPKLRFVDMSGTLISGHGLSSLAAAAGSSIEILRVGSCADVDDAGLRSVAQLCKNLRGIDVSHCSRITAHGLLYLAEMPSEQLRQLQWLNMSGTALVRDTLAKTTSSVAAMPAHGSHGTDSFMLSAAAAAGPNSGQQEGAVNNGGVSGGGAPRDTATTAPLLSPVAAAVISALEDGGFRGLLVADGQAPSGGLVKVYGHPEVHMIRKAYDSSPDTITDLCGGDITAQVLKFYHVCKAEGCPNDSTCESHQQINSSATAERQQSPTSSKSGGAVPGGGTNKKAQAYSIDLSDRFVNNMVLDLVLSRWGRRLAALKLNGTFITEAGLAHLRRCPNLRVLQLSRCANITSKSGANRAAMPCIARMTRLREVCISDSHISGRLFSEHPDLQLSRLQAARCPISVHAVRMLADLCADTMSWLDFTGCSYLNARSVHYLARFVNLRTLLLDFCTGLMREDVQRFAQTSGSGQTLTCLAVTGIPGMDVLSAQRIDAILGSNGIVQFEDRVSSARAVCRMIPPVSAFDSSATAASSAYAVMPGHDGQTGAAAVAAAVASNASLESQRRGASVGDVYMMMTATQLQTPNKGSSDGALSSALAAAEDMDKLRLELTTSQQPGGVSSVSHGIAAGAIDSAVPLSDSYSVFHDSDVMSTTFPRDREQQQQGTGGVVGAGAPSGAVTGSVPENYATLQSVDVVNEKGVDVTAVTASYVLLP